MSGVKGGWGGEGERVREGVVGADGGGEALGGECVDGVDEGGGQAEVLALVHQRLQPRIVGVGARLHVLVTVDVGHRSGGGGSGGGRRHGRHRGRERGTGWTRWASSCNPTAYRAVLCCAVIGYSGVVCG